MYVWTQQTCDAAALARTLNQLELDGWEVFQILPGARPTVVANRPAEREEVEAAIQQSPAQRPAPAAIPGLERLGARVPLSPDAPWWQEARQIALGGQKILAIKRVRAETGLGLKESKALVEQHIMTSPAPEAMQGMDDEARALVASGRKIQAIKLVRDRTRMGLREAKAYVEAL